jgi:short-subunit dehydrogenase
MSGRSGDRSTRRRILVTGAGAGLGRALSEQLISEGYHLVALDRDKDALATLGATETSARRSSVTAIIADLAEGGGLEALGARLAGEGPYHRVIMNAGINATGRFETIPEDRQRAMIAINLTAPMVLTAALLRAGAVAPGGALVFVSSLSRYVGYPGAACYSATKEGLAVFARSLRRPLAKNRIGVLTVCPGPLDTAHAAEHAPPGADASKRMRTGVAARIILRAADRPALAGLALGGGVIVPGLGPKVAAFAGKILPGSATGLMRKLIFEKM